VKELESQLAKERAENLVILENVRFSTRSVRDQTVFMMIMLCLQTHRISMLEKLTLELMRSHPIMLFYLFKERTALTC
jgi:hypothetical protein